jgi:2-polyprenyl-3-methyl-5-hydroxy-6-metoxy-1,4-benzoquinol methylase
MSEAVQTKYYDYGRKRFVNLQLDGCALVEWGQLYGERAFAWHPKGFKIFLPPNRLQRCDEYADSDPYHVEQNINSDFHARRVTVTVELVHEAVSRLRHTPRILDLGCGQGHITEKIRQALGTAEVTGLDYSVSAVEYAHEHCPELDVAVGDAYECPYAENFFDVVVCNNLWEHVPDPLHLLSRISALLKPGGHVIISTPSRYRLGNLARVLRGKPVEFMSSQHVTEYTVGQVTEQLVYGGYNVKRVLSSPIQDENLKVRVVRWLCRMCLSLNRSHHQLESTVFYMGEKKGA